MTGHILVNDGAFWRNEPGEHRASETIRDDGPAGRLSARRIGGRDRVKAKGRISSESAPFFFQNLTWGAALAAQGPRRRRPFRSRTCRRGGWRGRSGWPRCRPARRRCTVCVRRRCGFPFRQFILETQEVLVRLQLGVAFHHHEEPAQGAGEFVVGADLVRDGAGASHPDRALVTSTRTLCSCLAKPFTVSTRLGIRS
jgi:hypothetical protein